MTTRHPGWRVWLADAVSARLAGIGAFVLGRGTTGLSPAPVADLAGGPVLARAAPASRPGLPAAVAERRAAELDAAAVTGGQGRRRGHRAAADLAGGHIQQPPDRGQGSAPSTRPAAKPGSREHGLILPAWRTLLESRWQQRLRTVTELSVAYHDAAERSGGGHRAGNQGQDRHVRRLMREAVAARRALADTEEALTRLAAGSYGRCEQCATAIPASRLADEPEARYCARCAPASARHLQPGRKPGHGSPTAASTSAP